MLVEIDPRYFRPTEVDLLIGDPRKAREKLGWRHETSFDDLVAEMVREDLEVSRRAARRSGRNSGGSCMPDVVYPLKGKRDLGRRAPRHGRLGAGAPPRARRLRGR